MSSRASFDTLLDQLESRLQSYATSQEATDPLYAFSVYKDWMRDRAPEGHALVLLYLGPVTAQNDSADITEWGYEAQYWADLLTRKVGDRANSTRADEAAGLRARHLIKQVVDGLDFANDRDLGLSEGTIRRFQFPRIEPHPLDIQIGEASFTGYRMTFDFELAYEPPVDQGTALDKIEIQDPQRWSILLDL